ISRNLRYAPKPSWAATTSTYETSWINVLQIAVRLATLKSSLQLPVATLGWGTMNAIRPDGSHSPFDKRALRILIVDDCLDYRERMALLLGGLGHEVATTFDGRVALRIAIRNPPDVVFLDIALPGMDGYELARRLRAVTSRKHPLIVA